LESILLQFSNAEAPSGGIMESLGIDWQALILQVIAFLILLFLLSKFVFPTLTKILDDRQTKIDLANKAAEHAKQAAGEAELKVSELLKKARNEADDILSLAKLESENNVNASEKKAKKQAEQIIESAQADISRQIDSAKKALYDETLELVSMATGKIIGETMTEKLDKDFIEKSIKDIK